MLIFKFLINLKNSQQPVIQTDFAELAYSSQDVNYKSSFYIEEIAEWNIVLVAYSKMVDIEVLGKQPDNVS